MKKRALIFGASGMDGSILAELLLEKDYEVNCVIRRVAVDDPERLKRIWHIRDRVIFHSATMENYASIFKVIQKVQPDEIYHLAAQSFVAHSFDDQFSTMNVNINGTHYILTSILEASPHSKLCFAATSEMFGNSPAPQNESTPFMPRSTYGISKLASYHLVKVFREAYNLFCCSSICFNHEAPLKRGVEFVSRKITSTAVKIKLGLERELRLGNVEAKRDWGYAGDYVRAMQMMLGNNEPKDYVISTGTTHSVREFCEIAFSYLGLDYRNYIIIDPKFYRPAEVFELCGDSSRIRNELGWKQTVNFKQLVQKMVIEDYNELMDSL